MEPRIYILSKDGEKARRSARRGSHEQKRLAVPAQRVNELVNQQGTLWGAEQAAVLCHARATEEPG